MSQAPVNWSRIPAGNRVPWLPHDLQMEVVQIISCCQLLYVNQNSFKAKNDYALGYLIGCYCVEVLAKKREGLTGPTMEPAVISPRIGDC